MNYILYQGESLDDKPSQKNYVGNNTEIQKDDNYKELIK